MRFRATATNLEISLAGDDADEIAAAAARILIPRFTRKLYLLADGPCEYPNLAAVPGATIVREGAEPSNLTSNFRIVHRNADLFIAPAPSAGLTKDDLREIGSEIANQR
jgi:hypothetical protein